LPEVKAEGKLEKLGLRTGFDFILHLPLRYEDETALTAPQSAPQGRPVSVEAKVLKAQVMYRPKRQLIVHAEGLVLRFFHFYPSQLKQFERAAQAGQLVRAYGEVRTGFFGAEMAHPRYRIVSEGTPLPDTLTPIYPTTAGVSQAELRTRVLRELDCAQLDDTLPVALKRTYNVKDFAESVRLLHRPPPGIELAGLAERTHAAWQRIKFDELLAQQLSMRFAYEKRRTRRACALPVSGALLRQFVGKLPFTLTGAQNRALRELLHDLALATPMQRLLQGDVGSGKTIVAAIACLAAVDGGHQAAVMAPTEILAEQHWRKFDDWLAPLGVRLGWLHGGLARKEKKSVLDATSKGEVQIVIGTHALVQEGVDFASLALAVVDEQHRFGVSQRLKLRHKAAKVWPHQLMMSATPIPRTLWMTCYADLDVSVIDELPPGRRPVATRLFSAARRDEVLARVRDACFEGQQCYWVCPVIEESKEGDLQTALDTFDKLKKELSTLRVGLLHGKLPPAEKAAVMKAFQGNHVQLLVCTTVIEVGVDVPNASLMVIESAERFGLAQLHQLRGRVGRGMRESACILLFGEGLSHTARARLKVIHENSDGFEIARHDLELRGPGEYIGQRQSGEPLFRFADLSRDGALIESASRAAAELIDADPAAARAHVERWLGSKRELVHA
jgi:ATP-dependent DNA helicase RecG